jgi:hypothetical protein
MPTCEKCGREIMWKMTTDDEELALDPYLEITIAEQLDDGDTVRLVRGSRPHWASCPKSKTFGKHVRRLGNRGRPLEVVLDKSLFE